MKRNNLTAAVLAGLAGAVGIASTANAVNLNPDGLGQVLIYPYYTTNGGNDTLMSVVNSTDEAKAVKVRYLEGLNSQEVLDFNLYLSEFDVWVAAITNVTVNGVEGPGIVVPDSSCTVPYLFDRNFDEGVTTMDAFGNPDRIQQFVTFGLTDGGGADLSRATEGHMEIIEMGVLTNDSQDSADAATHALVTVDADGDGDAETPARRPADCEQLNDAWSNLAGVDGYWLTDSSIDISAPTGGLFGGGAVIDVPEGAMYSYDARAIEGFTTNQLHFEPGNIQPSLNDGNVRQAFLFFDEDSDGAPEPVTLSFTDTDDQPVDAVSAVFMHDTIMNEYVVSDSINALTEWVVTFPTKNFYVNGPDPDPDDEVDEASARQPFTEGFSGAEGACEEVDFDIWDREEAATVPGSRGPIVSPPPPPGTGPDAFELCFEAQVIRFGALEDGQEETEILGSSNFTNIDVDALGFGFEDAGWAKFFFQQDENELTAGNGLELVGLPVTGFAVQKFANGTLDGGNILANYGGIFDHKATRLVEEDSDVQAPAPATN